MIAFFDRKKTFFSFFETDEHLVDGSSFSLSSIECFVVFIPTYRKQKGKYEILFLKWQWEQLNHSHNAVNDIHLYIRVILFSLFAFIWIRQYLFNTIVCVLNAYYDV